MLKEEVKKTLKWFRDSSDLLRRLKDKKEEEVVKTKRTTYETQPRRLKSGDFDVQASNLG